MYRRIRELREDRDWSQANVAKELNCSQQVYSNYELGQRDIPTEVLIRCGCAGSFDHRSKEEKP